MRRDTLEKYTCLRRSTGCWTVASRNRRRTAPPRGHTELLRECQSGRGALGRTGHDGAPVGFAEQQLDSRKAQAASGEIDVETEARLVIWAPHRHLCQRDAKAALRAIVRGAEQAALCRRDEVVHEPPLDRQ